MIPLQETEAGTAIGVKTQQPLDNIQPSFNLPDDGHRPEDKQEEEGPQRFVEESGESEGDNQVRELPEIFQLVIAKDFRELFLLYFGEDQGEMMTIKNNWRNHLGSSRKQPISNWYTQAAEAQEKRSDSYDSTLFYHYTKPGKRFTGAM